VGRDRDSELEQQRAQVETAVRGGWVPVGTGEPRVLTVRAYAEARTVISRGGRTGAGPSDH